MFNLMVEIEIKNLIVVFKFGQIIDTLIILKVIFIFNFYIEINLKLIGYFKYNYFNINSYF